MKLKLLVLLLLITFNADAQKIRFSNPGNQWVTLMYFPCPLIATYTYSPIRDSIYSIYVVDTIAIEPEGCPVVPGYPNDRPPWFPTLSREDTLAGIVYYNWILGEKPLYNYNLQLGDTISYLLEGGSTYSTSLFAVDTVKSIDSILINGIYHKLFEFTGVYIDNSIYHQPNQYRRYTVLEGIGCIGNPFGPCEHNVMNCLRLLCFSQNGVYPEIHIPAVYYCDTDSYIPFTNSIGCTALGTATTTKADDKYVISPNPATGFVTISNPAGFAANSLFTVYDYTGRAITKHTLTTGATQEVINIATWLPGLYLINIQNGNTNVWQKVVVGR